MRAISNRGLPKMPRDELRELARDLSPHHDQEAVPRASWVISNAKIPSPIRAFAPTWCARMGPTG